MKARILLVEDEEALRMTIADRLEKENYVIECAVDGAEGLDKATHVPFDLIILDIMLPRRSGLDVCRDIRQAGLAIPVLFLTARAETVDKVVGLKLGGDDYLTKPFEIIELLARMEALLRRGYPESLHPPMYTNSARSESTFAVLRLPATGSASIFLHGNFNCCNTWSKIAVELFPATRSSAKCGAITKQPSPALWTCTWRDCARNWKSIPRNLI